MANDSTDSTVEIVRCWCRTLVGLDTIAHAQRIPDGRQEGHNLGHEPHRQDFQKDEHEFAVCTQNNVRWWTSCRHTLDDPGDGRLGVPRDGDRVFRNNLVPDSIAVCA